MPLNMFGDVSKVSFTLTNAQVQTESPIFKLTKYFGLMPLKNIRGKNKHMSEYVFSTPVYIMGVVFIILLSFVAISGLITDLYDDEKSSNSREKETIFDQVQVIYDMASLIIIIGLRVVYSPYVLANLTEFYKLIAQVDLLFPVETITPRIRALNKGAITQTIVTFLTAVAISNVCTFVTLNGDTRWFFLKHYMPFMLAYFITVIIEIEYIHMVRVIRCRFIAFNEHLKHYMHQLRGDNSLYFEEMHEKKHVWSIDAFAIWNDRVKSNKITDATKMLTFKDDTAHVRYIKDLRTAHILLFETITIVNNAYGFIIICLLVTNIFHLVETIYNFLRTFLQVQIVVLDCVKMFIWTLIHVGRLLLYIEACHKCSNETHKTNKYICQGLNITHLSSALKKQLELFSLQLLHTQGAYSAFDFCTLDRTLISQIAGATTTYIVVLFQFNKTV